MIKLTGYMGRDHFETFIKSNGLLYAGEYRIPTLLEKPGTEYEWGAWPEGWPPVKVTVTIEVVNDET